MHLDPVRVASHIDNGVFRLEVIDRCEYGHKTLLVVTRYQMALREVALSDYRPELTKEELYKGDLDPELPGGWDVLSAHNLDIAAARVLEDASSFGGGLIHAAERLSIRWKVC